MMDLMDEGNRERAEQLPDHCAEAGLQFVRLMDPRHDPGREPARDAPRGGGACLIRGVRAVPYPLSGQPRDAADAPAPAWRVSS